MSSPKPEVLFVYNLTTGVPLTGQAGSMSFSSYKDDLGTNLSQPTITEIGGGAYKFTPTFADPARGIIYVLSTGTNANPTYVARYMRPEDYLTDSIPDIQTSLLDLQNFLEGTWKIETSGPDANRMVFYKPDGVTVLYKFDLQDDTGTPTVISPFRRIRL